MSTLLLFLLASPTTVTARRRPFLLAKEFDRGFLFQNATDKNDAAFSAEANCAAESDFHCLLSDSDEDGAYVCRSWIHKSGKELKKVGCFPANRSLLGTDDCGCCGRECRSLCNMCPCVTRRGRAGAYIVYEGRDEPVCRSIYMATNLVYRDENIACLADCDFTT